LPSFFFRRPLNCVIAPNGTQQKLDEVNRSQQQLFDLEMERLQVEATIDFSKWIIERPPKGT
jgi:hypothetical protein